MLYNRHGCAYMYHYYIEAIMLVPQPVGVCNSGERRFAYDFVMRANNE